MQYADLLTKVQAGHVVAVAPARNERGEPLLVVASGEIPEPHRQRMHSATNEQRAGIALRAVRQVREHYRI